MQTLLLFTLLVLFLSSRRDSRKRRNYVLGPRRDFRERRNYVLDPRRGFRWRRNYVLGLGGASASVETMFLVSAGLPQA